MIMIGGGGNGCGKSGHGVGITTAKEASYVYGQRRNGGQS